jgi:orotate phosphoribosyltransferase
MSAKAALLAEVLEKEALTFGSFKLKSGRVSPYFFNMGRMQDAQSLWALGRACAETIHASGIAFDVLFGLPYKGIPLVVATAMCLQSEHGQTVSYGFFRKEPKPHGEGGMVVGAEPKGRVLLIDDVLTQGTAVHQAMVDLKAWPSAVVAGLVLVLDRQERTDAGMSATEAITEAYDMPLLSALGFQDLLAYGQQHLSDAQHDALKAYQAAYGVKANEGKGGHAS